MAAGEDELSNGICDGTQSDIHYLQNFRLYETRSNFYMIGRDKYRTFWRVLKIDRSDASVLNIVEDSTVYLENECGDLLKRIQEGNRSTGGLKFVTTCYGIIGFIKFLGPYYMLIITERRKIGTICGHTIYAITKSEMISIPNSSAQSNMAYSNNENRYKKLLCTVDLTKDFFFSYSYHVMNSLQKNICKNETGNSHYETMFVWNEFLTRGIRSILKNTDWTVALVHGFFKQVKLSESGRDFKLTLIARRSRHYAGTRYLKRGVNKRGRVANDVETEQIVFEDVPEGFPMQITSVVQMRGSIPLVWSQETSRLNIKPDIILAKDDDNYEATRLHFANLAKRYGNPIVILNLIKTREKKPRETILGAEFANAIRVINKDLPEEDNLRFLHWDLNKYSKKKSTNVLALLGKVASYSLNLTNIFYFQANPNLRPEGLSKCAFYGENNGDSGFLSNLSSEINDADNLEFEGSNDRSDDSEDHLVKPMMFQKGVLRTNCIDCLDRTNVAQYAYGLVALGRQLYALGLVGTPDIDLDNPLAEELMSIYENMGDTLALQYAGSAAHSKIFSNRRGQWKAATQSQELLISLHRYYSNAYMDAEKQDAINVFLGHFQPQQGKPALWELGSDQHYDARRGGPNSADENGRTSVKRSMSDGNIIWKSNSHVSATHIGYSQHLSEKVQGGNRVFPDSTTMTIFENDISYSSDEAYSSNFLNIDWLSSSENSCEEGTSERSIGGLSSENVANDLSTDTSASASESPSSNKGLDKSGTEPIHKGLLNKFSKSFADWVAGGVMLL